jgi:UDP-glucose 4-epimerase
MSESPLQPLEYYNNWVNRTGAWNVISTPRFVPLVITRFILSSAVGAGEFGRYARFALDEERSLGQSMVATTFTDPSIGIQLRTFAAT